MKSTRDLIALHKERFMREHESVFESLVGHGESPIEELLIAHLVACRHYESTGGLVPKAVTSAIEWRNPSPLWLTAGGFDVFVQAPIIIEDHTYRADFAVFFNDVRAIVELDGHDFHERTRDQASRDKRRDRRFASAGWMVLRFTGSDVHRDADALWSEVERTLIVAHRRGGR